MSPMPWSQRWHDGRVDRRGVPAVLVLFVAAAGCASSPVTSAVHLPKSVPVITAAPATTVVAAPTTSPTEVPTTAAAGPPPCPHYPSAIYGIDPADVSQTGGGTQLVTVVAPTSRSLSGILVAWSKGTDGCWRAVGFNGQPAQPYRAETGYGGLVPFAQRQPFDGTTPTGLFSFGAVVYGNSAANPSARYPYHHLECGDWWDEEPGSPTYDTFQHVPCGTTPAYAGDSEALWTETQPYQHFLDIPMPNPPDHVAGIFLHDDTTAGDTAGCVALPDAVLDAVLGWLDPADAPHILIAVG
jgi:L,D-peptidoglycan transpeptidase YkuD (ErfK/YbiS/YcfS/YnhG family)